MFVASDCCNLVPIMHGHEVTVRIWSPCCLGEHQTAATWVQGWVFEGCAMSDFLVLSKIVGWKMRLKTFEYNLMNTIWWICGMCNTWVGKRYTTLNSSCIVWLLQVRYNEYLYYIKNTKRYIIYIYISSWLCIDLSRLFQRHVDKQFQSPSSGEVSQIGPKLDQTWWDLSFTDRSRSTSSLQSFKRCTSSRSASASCRSIETSCLIERFWNFWSESCW